MPLKWVTHSGLAPTDGPCQPPFLRSSCRRLQVASQIPSNSRKTSIEDRIPQIVWAQRHLPEPPIPTCTGLARQKRRNGNREFQNSASRTPSLACTRSVQLHNAESVKPIVVSRCTYNLSHPNRCSTLLRYPFSPNPSTPTTSRMPNASGVWGCAHSNGEFRLR